MTCRVLKLCRQQYYRWLHKPVTDGQLDEAYPADEIFDAHRDDPEFGYRFLADEIRLADHDVSDRVVWRICRDNAWWSAFGKARSRKGSKPGAPSHDDLVRRNFTADAPNVVWLGDITEHWTDEGKLYCCAIKDLFSNRIVGYSIDSRMKARLVVAAIEMAVARRGGDVPGCILHTDRGSQFRARKVHRVWPATAWSGRWARSVRRRQRRHGIILRIVAEERPRPTIPMDHPRQPPDGRSSPGSNALTADAAAKPPSAA